MTTEKHFTWHTKAGKRERWEYTRADGLELGQVSECCPPMPASQFGCYQGHGSWSAITPKYRSKYFVHKEHAIKWLENQSRNIYPFSRLNEMLERV